MIAEGALDGVAGVSGIHVFPTLPSGTIATKVLPHMPCLRLSAPRCERGHASSLAMRTCAAARGGVPPCYMVFQAL